VHGELIVKQLRKDERAIGSESANENCSAWGKKDCASFVPTSNNSEL
jgi:hypothetical protein